jgi:hypothetical protein
MTSRGVEEEGKVKNERGQRTPISAASRDPAAINNQSY